jgi:hypothetical protein
MAALLVRGAAPFQNRTASTSVLRMQGGQQGALGQLTEFGATFEGYADDMLSGAIGAVGMWT